MSKIEVNDKEHLLSGLFLYECAYKLSGEVFTEELSKEIRDKTLLEMSDPTWDWFTHLEVNPILSWPQMISLALGILNCESTKLFVNGLYLETIPSFEMKEIDESIQLPELSISGAKRVNAGAGDYTDYSDMMGIAGLVNQKLGRDVSPKDIKLSNQYFRLSGKDESCCVEGSWLDWCMFACNVLASKNTELIAPKIYAPTMANNNY